MYEIEHLSELLQVGIYKAKLTGEHIHSSSFLIS